MTTPPCLSETHEHILLFLCNSKCALNATGYFLKTNYFLHLFNVLFSFNWYTRKPNLSKLQTSASRALGLFLFLLLLSTHSYSTQGFNWLFKLLHAAEEFTAKTRMFGSLFRTEIFSTKLPSFYPLNYSYTWLTNQKLSN